MATKKSLTVKSTAKPAGKKNARAQIAKSHTSAAKHSTSGRSGTSPTAGEKGTSKLVSPQASKQGKAVAAKKPLSAKKSQPSGPAQKKAPQASAKGTPKPTTRSGAKAPGKVKTSAKVTTQAKLTQVSQAAKAVSATPSAKSKPARNAHNGRAHAVAAAAQSHTSNAEGRDERVGQIHALFGFERELVGASIKDVIASPAAAKLGLMEAEVGQLRVMPGFNPRLRTPKLQAHIRSIADSMKTEGYYRDKPLAGFAAYENGEIVVFVTEGHCRNEALGIAVREGAPITHIPVMLKEKSTTMEDLTVALARGNQGMHFTPLEMSVMCKRLNKFGMSSEVIASRLGITEVYVNTLLMIAGAPSAIREMLAADEITAGTARDALHTYKDKAVEVLQKALEEAKAHGKTRVTLKHLPAHAGKKQLLKMAPTMLDVVHMVRDLKEFVLLPPVLREKIQQVMDMLSGKKPAAGVKAKASSPATAQDDELEESQTPSKGRKGGGDQGGEGGGAGGNGPGRASTEVSVVTARAVGGPSTSTAAERDLDNATAALNAVTAADALRDMAAVEMQPVDYIMGGADLGADAAAGSSGAGEVVYLPSGALAFQKDDTGLGRGGQAAASSGPLVDSPKPATGFRSIIHFEDITREVNWSSELHLQMYQHLNKTPRAPEMFEMLFSLVDGGGRSNTMKLTRTIARDANQTARRRIHTMVARLERNSLVQRTTAEGVSVTPELDGSDAAAETTTSANTESQSNNAAGTPVVITLAGLRWFEAALNSRLALIKRNPNIQAVCETLSTEERETEMEKFVLSFNPVAVPNAPVPSIPVNAGKAAASDGAAGPLKQGANAINVIAKLSLAAGRASRGASAAGGVA